MTQETKVHSTDGFFSDDFKAKLKATTQTSVIFGLAIAAVAAPIALVLAVAKRVGGGSA